MPGRGAGWRDHRSQRPTNALTCRHDDGAAGGGGLLGAAGGGPSQRVLVASRCAGLRLLAVVLYLLDALMEVTCERVDQLE